uniref:hypothetical protein n=1 Tax=Ornithobacterium rhinotracheale TaxID=28251 RepID=UPI0039A65D08
MKNIISIIFLLVVCVNTFAQRKQNHTEIIKKPKKGVLVELYRIDNDDNSKLIVTNYLDKEITINKFILGTSMFILEYQVGNEPVHNMNCSPPPIPPDNNLKKYDTILNPDAKMEFFAHTSLMNQCIEIRKIKQTDIKIRAVINYKYMGSDEKFTEYSNWINY